jgi:hypothetical protein
MDARLTSISVIIDQRLVINDESLGRPKTYRLRWDVLQGLGKISKQWLIDLTSQHRSNPTAQQSHASTTTTYCRQAVAIPSLRPNKTDFNPKQKFLDSYSKI